jgi:hypothetical protein
MLGVCVSELDEAECVFNCNLPLRTEQNRYHAEGVNQTSRASTRLLYGSSSPQSKLLHGDTCVATGRFRRS